MACVYWKGKFRNREFVYTSEWVLRLQAMVRKWLPMEHTFVCLTNVEIPGCNVIPLQHHWPGWWSKLELFRPDLFGKEDRVLYLDLDVVVVASLEPLVNYPARFAIVKRFGNGPLGEVG